MHSKNHFVNLSEWIESVSQIVMLLDLYRSLFSLKTLGNSLIDQIEIDEKRLELSEYNDYRIFLQARYNFLNLLLKKRTTVN